MTRRTTIQSSAGTLLQMSATRPATFDAAGYQDTTIAWTTVGEIEDHGAHGVVAQIIEFTAVNDAIVQKLKGSKNYGTKNLVIGDVPSDAGQIILEAASESQNRYSARIVYPLGDGEVSNELHFLDVLVASAEHRVGTANDVRKYAVALAITKKPVKVAAT